MSDKTLSVGSAVASKRAFPAIGVSEGELGWVYEDYGSGVSIIFENGGHDGFSREDDFDFLEDLHIVDDGYANYEFINVWQVTQDYEKGYWEFKL